MFTFHVFHNYALQRQSDNDFRQSIMICRIIDTVDDHFCGYLWYFIFVCSGSSGVVNSLGFYLASLKSLGCFYFGCVFSSQWRAVTVNSQSYSANFKSIFEGP